jgi:hypothetical protein
MFLHSSVKYFSIFDEESVKFIIRKLHSFWTILLFLRSTVGNGRIVEAWLTFSFLFQRASLVLGLTDSKGIPDWWDTGPFAFQLHNCGSFVQRNDCFFKILFEVESEFFVIWLRSFLFPRVNLGNRSYLKVNRHAIPKLCLLEREFVLVHSLIVFLKVKRN